MGVTQVLTHPCCQSPLQPHSSRITIHVFLAIHYPTTVLYKLFIINLSRVSPSKVELYTYQPLYITHYDELSMCWIMSVSEL